MPTESAQNIEEVQDQPLLDEIFAKRNELGVPEFYLQYSYREHELRSAGNTTNYGRPLHDALLEQPVSSEKVEALLTVSDDEGNPLLDVQVHIEEIDLEGKVSRVKKNLLSVLMHAEVVDDLKIRWLKQILSLRTIDGGISINITNPKILNLLMEQADLLGAEYSKIILEESEKQALIIRREDALTRISWIIKNGDLLELKSILSDRDKMGVPHAYTYYQQQPGSNPGGPLGDALSALPSNRIVISAVLFARDNAGNLLWSGSPQPRFPDIPLVIQAARLSNLEYLTWMLEVKNADGSSAFDVNEIFEGRTALDIVSQSSNPERERCAAFIKFHGGKSYETLKNLFLEDKKNLSPKTADAIIAWNVKLKKSELLRAAYNRTKSFLNSYPSYEARNNAIYFLNDTIEKLGQRKNYSLSELNNKLRKTINEFYDLDQEIFLYDPSSDNSPDLRKYILMLDLINDTYDKYEIAQPKDKVTLLRDGFINRAKEISQANPEEVMTFFSQLTQALEKKQEQQSLLERGGPR